MSFTTRPKDDKEWKQLEMAISSWKALEPKLKKFSERQLKKAMYVEFRTNGRKFIVGRLKSRYNVLRARRENAFIDANTWK